MRKVGFGGDFFLNSPVILCCFHGYVFLSAGFGFYPMTSFYSFLALICNNNSYFPPPVALPVCPSAGLRASAEWSSRGFFNTFNASICSRFGVLPGSKHRAHSPAAWRITRFGHRIPAISGMDLAIGRWQVLFRGSCLVSELSAF